MRAAAAAWKAAASMVAPPPRAPLLHSTALFSKWCSKSHSTGGGKSQESSKTYARFVVREKRNDAKSALKNLLLNNERSSKQYSRDSCNKQKRHQKAPGKSKFRGKNQHTKGKGWQNWRSFDEDDCPDTSYGSFGGKTSFTWYWPGGNDNLGSSPTGFEWKDDSQWTKTRARVWSESDIDEEEESGRVDYQKHRIALGLPPLGPLKVEDVKSAFRASALKWHPDKHQGPSQAEAEEKFKRCVEAYNSLAGVLKSSS